jgi:hypothetical protein
LPSFAELSGYLPERRPKSNGSVAIWMPIDYTYGGFTILEADDVRQGGARISSGAAAGAGRARPIKLPATVQGPASPTERGKIGTEGQRKSRSCTKSPGRIPGFFGAIQGSWIQLDEQISFELREGMP